MIAFRSRIALTLTLAQAKRSRTPRRSTALSSIRLGPSHAASSRSPTTSSLTSPPPSTPSPLLRPSGGLLKPLRKPLPTPSRLGFEPSVKPKSPPRHPRPRSTSSPQRRSPVADSLARSSSAPPKSSSSSATSSSCRNTTRPTAPISTSRAQPPSLRAGAPAANLSPSSPRANYPRPSSASSACSPSATPHGRRRRTSLRSSRSRGSPSLCARGIIVRQRWQSRGRSGSSRRGCLRGFCRWGSRSVSSGCRGVVQQTVLRQ